MKKSHNITTKNRGVHYDDFAETFGKSRRDLHWPEIDVVLEEFLVDFHPSSGVFGDIGCGNGRLLSHINHHRQNEVYKSLFSTYVGFDISHALLEQARSDEKIGRVFPSVNWRE